MIRIPTLTFALVLAPPVLAEPDMGALAAFLPPDGEGGGWSVARSEEGLTLANRADPEAVEYVAVETGSAEDAASVAVRLAAPLGAEAAGGAGFAGLVLGHDAAAGSYWVFGLSGGGTASLYRRDAAGLSVELSADIGGDPGGWRVLAVREAEDRVALTVDGRALGTVEAPGIADGGIGIAAGGPVTATFDAFTLE